MQMEHHPDKHASKGEESRAAAEEVSAALNEAYKILKHPVSRAEHMVKKKVLPWVTRNASCKAQNIINLPGAFALIISDPQRC